MQLVLNQSKSNSRTMTNLSCVGAIQIVVTQTKKVSCDGSEANSSHPLVYLNMGDKNEVVCPYCSCCFQLKNSSSTSN